MTGTPATPHAGVQTPVRLGLAAIVAALATLLLAAALGAASASAATCPNQVFRAGAGLKLPDCRAYELVTPEFTGGQKPEMNGFLGDEPHSFDTQLISPSGDAVPFNVIGGALSGMPGTGYTDRYLARRTAQGWKTELTGLSGEEVERASYGLGFSPEMEYFFANAHDVNSMLWPSFLSETLPVLHTPSGYEPIARGDLGETNQPCCNMGRFISAGGHHVIFQTNKQLEPNAPPDGTTTIYDREAGSTSAHVVSLLPGDVTPTESARYFNSSSDGSEVAFGFGFGNWGGFNGPLYVRRNNTETVEAVGPTRAVVGQALECKGGPSSGATLTYEWLRNGAPIGGASSAQYTTTAADEGTVVQCRVTASNAEGTSVFASAGKLVEGGEKQPPIPPSFLAIALGTGTTSVGAYDNQVDVGQLYNCYAGTGNPWKTPTPPTVTYQWLRNGAPIGGASSSTYTIVAADVGKAIQCQATGSNSDGTAVKYSSAAIGVPGVPFTTATANPTITNTTHSGEEPKVGDTLSCAPGGTWTGSPTLAYQWVRSDTAIGGATTSSYTVTAEDEDHTLQCRVDATNEGVTTQAVSPSVTVEGPLLSGKMTHPLIGTFGTAKQPGFKVPAALAVDQSNGDVYVLDTSEGSLSRFKPDGSPDEFSELGKNEIRGLSGYLQQIAVDRSGGATNGNIYVSTYEGVKIYAQNGEPLGMLNASSEGSLEYTAGVAVDSSGTVWVDQGGHIRKYVPSGSVPVNGDNTANYSYSGANNLAVSGSYLYVVNSSNELFKVEASTGEAKYKIASNVSTVSVDPSSGHVYALMGSEFKEFDASGATSAKLVSKTSLAEQGHGIAVRGSNQHVFASEEYYEGHVYEYGPAVPAAPSPPQLTDDSYSYMYGSGRVGQTLSCNPGYWSGSPSFERQWLRNGEEIAGATGYSYTVTNEDLGKVVQCRVIATNEDGVTEFVLSRRLSFYGQGPMYISGQVPVATASLPETGFTFLGIFNHHVFYTDSEENGSFYYTQKPANLYSIDLETGKGKAITNTGDAITVNISDDASHVYFASKSKYNGEGTAGEWNFYVWDQSGAIKYIGILPERDLVNWTDGKHCGCGGNGTASLGTWGGWMQSPDKSWERGRALSHTRSTPDGNVLVFESTGSLTGFNSEEATPEDCGEFNVSTKTYETGDFCTQVYRYEASTGDLVCLSCPAGSNGPAEGYATLQDSLAAVNDNQPVNQSTPVANVTENGEEVFFDTTESLLPQDGNETTDVYRWKKGQPLGLISTGQSLEASVLYAVTPNGDDVVFSTGEKLLAQDENGSTQRLYDARRLGGFPPPESSVTEPCNGDICQGSPSPAPESLQNSSASLSGQGNVPPQIKCPKGKRRIVRNGREICVKKHHKKHHRKKHHKRHHHRGAGR